jgi:hypothetical protein
MMKNRALKKITVILALFLAMIGLNTSCGANTEFEAKLTDSITKKPVPDARVILAHKKIGKPECTIDIALSGISNQNGDVRIKNVPKGEYVIFYNISGKIIDKLKDKTVGYDPVSAPNLSGVSSQPGYLQMITRTLDCPITIMPGGQMTIVDGNFVVDGYFYAEQLDLGMISTNGELLKTRFPYEGKKQLTIEINTDIGNKAKK